MAPLPGVKTIVGSFAEYLIVSVSGLLPFLIWGLLPIEWMK